MLRKGVDTASTVSEMIRLRTGWTLASTRARQEIASRSMRLHNTVEEDQIQGLA